MTQVFECMMLDHLPFGIREAKRGCACRGVGHRADLRPLLTRAREAC